MAAEQPAAPRRRPTWRDRGAAVVHDARALVELFATVSVYGAALVVAGVWLGLALRALLATSGLR